MKKVKVIAYRDVFGNRNFFLLWLGQIISQFGDRLTQMALIGLVYEVMPHTSLSLAKIMSLAIIPVFLVSPVSGVYVDRWNKRKTMYICDFLRAAFILLIPFFALKVKSLLAVYALIFLSFSVGRFFIPAKMALLPSLVKEKEVFMANSLISTTAMVAAVFGFGIGGIIVEKYGFSGAFLVDGVTFLLSSFLVFLMRTREKAHFAPRDILNLGKDVVSTVKRSFLYEFKQGVEYIFHSRETQFALKVFSLLFACLGALYVVFIVFIQQTLSSVTKDVGFFAVFLGVGLFIGSLVYGKVGHKLNTKRIIKYVVLILALYLIFFAVFLKYHPQKLFALISSFVMGFVGAPVISGVNALIHQESKNELWGRIFSSLEIVIHFAFIVFMFLASYLAGIFSPFTIIVCVGIIISLFMLLLIFKKNGESKRT